MKFVSVTTSMAQSQSVTTKTVITGEDIIKQAKDELDISDDCTVHLDADEYNKEDDSSTNETITWDDDEW